MFEARLVQGELLKKVRCRSRTAGTVIKPCSRA